MPPASSESSSEASNASSDCLTKNDSSIEDDSSIESALEKNDSESISKCSKQYSDQIAHRLATIGPEIPSTVRLIAVTKTFSAEIVRAAYDAGLRDFAENKVQEALAKQAELSDLTDVTWHFIGHVQSNKSRKVLENFAQIHSVDSLKLAARLDRQAAELGKCPLCYLQVKLASDPTKDGFELDELHKALPELDQLSHLKIVGLMVIPPYGLSMQQTREIFEQGRALADELQQKAWRRLRFTELSMGMSGDFELAIAAGSTAVRIGSGLFGQRDQGFAIAKD